MSDDGALVVPDVEDINFGANLDVTDDGDDTVTVDADRWDTSVAAQGNDLQGLGALSMSANSTPITDFAGPGLSINGGVLTASGVGPNVDADLLDGLDWDDVDGRFLTWDAANSKLDFSGAYESDQDAVTGSVNTASGTGAVVAGGANNIASGAYSSIGGGGGSSPGRGNEVTRQNATLGGGARNIVESQYSTIGGGLDNTVEFGTEKSTIGGGFDNTVKSSKVTIAGGDRNVASDTWATVGGGVRNTASGGSATVGGGRKNTASGTWSTVGGGIGNTAGGSLSATVGGGNNNTASGEGATVPGGLRNAANGKAAFATGRLASAQGHDGAFVWGDSTSTAALAQEDNEVVFQAGGARSSGPAVRMFSQSDGLTGVKLEANSGSWSSLSSRSVKRDLASVDPRNVLDRLDDVAIKTWRYDGQPDDVRHIGPMAEDFHEAFAVGTDDRHITSVDADGVALAAIKGVSERVDELTEESGRRDDRIAELEAETAALRAENDDLRERVASLEAHVLGEADGTAPVSADD